MSKHQLTNDELKEWLIEFNTEVQFRRLRLTIIWLTMLLDSGIHIVQSTGRASDLEVYFIKLCGLLEEGSAHLNQYFLLPEHLEIIEAQFPDKPFNSAYKLRCAKAHEAITAIQNGFTKEERFALLQIRDEMCHLILNGRTVRIIPETERLEIMTNHGGGQDKRALRKKNSEIIDTFGGIVPMAIKTFERIQPQVESLLSVFSDQNQSNSIKLGAN